MAQVISILSLKGGVGKTTLATHLACSLALSGIKTTLFDIDPSRDAARIFGFDDHGKLNLFEGFPPVPSEFLGLDLGVIGEKTKLDQLQDWSDQRDYIIFDCPPSLNDRTRKAISLSDFILIPVDCGSKLNCCPA